MAQSRAPSRGDCRVPGSLWWYLAGSFFKISLDSSDLKMHFSLGTATYKSLSLRRSGFMQLESQR